ncbi:MAG: 4-hydroxy-tetrahydrodipicolinate synthase [Stellaceae bacterium]
MSAIPACAVATLRGYATAVPTPFRGDHIDENAFRAFCDWQIGEGIAALVVNGTTGEAPTLSLGEQRRLIRAAVETAAGRVPVIAGAGSNATAHAVEIAREAEAAGADGLLAVTPYYNRPSQRGLFLHFRAMHDATSLPILLYDVPSRTACSLAIDTVLRLADLQRIVGLKDATGDLARALRLHALVGDRFRLLSGDDATTLDFLTAGGHGAISVVANVAPALAVRLHRAWQRGAAGDARAIAAALAPLAAALFAESNPVPVKCALEAMGWMSAAVRLPLCAASDKTRGQVAAALGELGLMPPREPAACALQIKIE